MDTQFETLDTYMLLAKKIISKFAPTFYSSLRKELLSNEDAIADIASSLMTADWKWDKNRVGHNGQSKTRYSYRNQCGIWAIKTYVSNKYKKKNNKKYSIDNISDSDLKTFSSHIVDKSLCDPQKILEQQEEKQALKETISRLLSSNAISEKQKKQIEKYYFENQTLIEIGKEYGVTREAIRQSIQKGIKNIREYANAT